MSTIHCIICASTMKDVDTVNFEGTDINNSEGPNVCSLCEQFSPPYFPLHCRQCGTKFTNSCDNQNPYDDRHCIGCSPISDDEDAGWDLQCKCCREKFGPLAYDEHLMLNNSGCWECGECFPEADEWSHARKKEHGRCFLKACGGKCEYSLPGESLETLEHMLEIKGTPTRYEDLREPPDWEIVDTWRADLISSLKELK